MFLLVSVPNEAFHRVMSVRALQKRLGIDTSVYRNASDLLQNVEKSFGGRLVLLDWRRREVVADLPVPGASGIAEEGDTLFASSWTGNCVHVLPAGQTAFTISHPWFNHLHTVETTPSGGLLIASAGIDLILEVSLDGNVTWSWYGPDHGYPSPSGAIFEPQTEYSLIRRSTSERAMHVTCALPWGEDKVLATLFHQGTLIEIDRRTGAARTILEGLIRPHGIHRRPGGFLLSDTLGHRIILLDDDLRRCAEIPYGSEWLQDTIPLSSGSYLTLENVHIDQDPRPGLSNRIVEIDTAGRPLQQLTVPADHRLFTVREIEEDAADRVITQWARSNRHENPLENWAWQ